jgi:5-methylcytosine-specific restriction protein B
MTLDEYTQAGSKDSFTYWIESRLDELGGIGGGSAFKFGVFSRKNAEEKKSDDKLSYSGTHGWYSSLGATGWNSGWRASCRNCWVTQSGRTLPK